MEVDQNNGTDGSSSDEEMQVPKKTTKKRDVVSDDEDFEDDTVIWEKNVVVCNSFPNTEMYCVSYPAGKRDAWDKIRVPTARFKKNVRVLEMRLLVDTQTGSFDKKKAEMMYQGGESTSSTPMKNHDISSLRKNDEIFEGRAFVNDHPIINSIGFLRNNQFYIHPVAGDFEMHRSIAGLNRKKKGGQKAEEDDGGSTEDEDDEKANTSSGNVRVKFSRPETERQKKRREASALHREKKIASDVWIPMDVHLEEDEKSKLKMDRLSHTGIKTEEDTNEGSGSGMEIRDLVNRAIICSIKEELVIESGKEHMLSMQRIEELPPDLQVKAQMVKSHVIRTDEMAKLVGENRMSRHDLIQCLQNCAQLVNGVWVLQSDLLFNNLPPAHSNVAGRTDVYRSELWRNARDLALCLIDGGHRVTRLTLITCFRVNEKDADEILSTFGVKDEVKRTWKLRIERDEDFLRDPYAQQLIQREKNKWIERFEVLQNLISSTTKPPVSPSKKK